MQPTPAAFAPPPPDVRLETPPLVRVLAQLRFPVRASIAQPEFIGPFQEAARSRYPILRKSQEVGLLVTPEGPAPTPSHGVIWRLNDRDSVWQTSLAPNFLSIQTVRYAGQAEFMERLREALMWLDTIGAPEVVDRFGLRYVNRIECKAPSDLRDFVRDDILGFVARDDIGDATVTVDHSISQHRFAFENEGALQVRHGFIPANASLDPTTDPASTPTWLLDLDMSVDGPRDYALDDIMSLAARFHDRIYAFFRWAMTDEFLRSRGGQL